MRLISEDEYQTFLRCKAEREQNEDESSMELSVLNNQQIPDDIKLQIYEKNTKRKKPKFEDNPPTSVPVVAKPKTEDNKETSDETFTTFSQTYAPDVSHKKLDDVEERNFLMDLADGSIGRMNAIHLLTIFKNYPEILSWNRKGNLSFFQNPYDPRTNIRKLVKFLFKQTQQAVPPGLTRLFRAMSYLRITGMIIMNAEARKEYLDFYDNDDLDNTYHTGFLENAAASNVNIPPNIPFEPLREEDRIRHHSANI